MSGSAVFTFETTHQAMWAEDVALERGVPAEVIPAPPEARAKCGLALQTLSDRAEELEGAMRDEGIEFHRHV
ncbi:MAG: DUF3343 domain-containing protein [Gemmatimonadetes bacterium]|nr:DUF3343 domain-containing protein [Gemmatimonadota bacterium]